MINLKFEINDLDEFILSCNSLNIDNNCGGMAPPDMFSFWFLLKKLNPKIVIESGVWNGFGTKLIRNTLGKDVKIICLDPLVPQVWMDENKNTTYYVGDKFIDFSQLSLDVDHKEEVLCFFDDHQNSAQRLIQSKEKGFKHLFFNDNYPVNCGSHFTIQHLLLKDDRQRFDLFNQYHYALNVLPQIDMSKRDEIISYINTYHIFPNIYPSKIETYEGTFDSEAFFTNDEHSEKYSLFKKSCHEYSWNTYLTLK